MSCEDIVKLIGEEQHDELAAVIGDHVHLFCNTCNEPSSLGMPVFEF